MRSGPYEFNADFERDFIEVGNLAAHMIQTDHAMEYLWLVRFGIAGYQVDWVGWMLSTVT